MNRPIIFVFISCLLVILSCKKGADKIKKEFVDPASSIKGMLLYEASMAHKESIDGWEMEGPGEILFKEGWMHMRSPGEEGHHVFWAPKRFSESFVAQWEAQNMEMDAGLCIVFFAATGLDGQSIFSDQIPERTGSFQQYVNGEIRNYHISYYANAAHNPDRGTANLRKNPGKHLVYKGEEGVPTESKSKHIITLLKNGNHIRFWVDERKIIDWVDKGKIGSKPYGEGFLGLRQMQWTHFRYSDFRVWSVTDSVSTP